MASEFPSTLQTVPEPGPAPWILLRGLARESGHWGRFGDMMANAVAPHEVHRIDLPGNGTRFAEKTPLSVARMMESVRAELAARGVQPPYLLFSMSLGAMVATAWAHAHASEVQGLVLVNTSLRPFSPLFDRLSPRAMRTLARVAMPATTALAAESSVLRLTSNRGGPSARKGLLSEWVALREAHPVSRANALRQLAAAALYRAPRMAPSPPVLLLASRGDRLASPRCSETLAKAWNVPLRMHPDAGHDLPLDDGPWVTRRVQEWLVRFDLPLRRR